MTRTRCPLRLGNEFRLLAACAIRPSGADQHRWLETLETLASTVSSWNELTRLTQRHQLAGLVTDALRRLPGGAVPADTMAALSLSERSARISTLTQIAESKKIGSAFAAAGIDAVQLKGAPLSKRLYGNAFLRNSTDLDILVSVADLDVAAKTLGRLGQRPVEAVPTGSGMSARLTRVAHYHCEFDNPALGIHTELHWRLHGRSAAAAAGELSRRVPDDTTGLPALRPAAELVDLLLHGSNHYWHMLKWLADIQQALIVASDETWAEVAAQSAALGGTHALRMTLLLASWVFEGLGPRPRFTVEPTRLAALTARYALRREQARRVVAVGLRSATDRAVYRLLSSTPYGRFTALLRCVC